MKKIIGIYCDECGDSSVWDDNIVHEEGAGGSETWVVEIAAEFQRRGFHVIVFGNPPYWRFTAEGVEYVPRQYFKARIGYQHFDYFIFWRDIEKLSPDLPCSEVYAIAEDMVLYHGGTLQFNKLKKVACLSDWAQEYLMKSQSIPLECLFKTFNPVPSELYKNADSYVKKNKMVWSSTTLRAFPYFVKNVFPHIKEAVPDFTVDVCSYLKTDTEDFAIEGINFLGKLNKAQLAEKQKESKIWAYPNDGKYYNGHEGFYFQETFCNTAVENGLAKNAVFCFNIGGVADTLCHYEGVIGAQWGNKYVGELSMSNDDLQWATEKIVEVSIKALTDEDYRQSIADNAYEICQKYSPANAVNTWLKEWGVI